MEIIEEHIMTIFPATICIAAAAVWFSVVGTDVIAYLFRNKCKNCKQCIEGKTCRVGGTPITECNLNGKCGLFEKI